MIDFEHPLFLFLLVLPPLFLLWYLRKGRLQEATIRFSAIELIPRAAVRSGERKVKFLLFLKFLVFILLIIALARPRVTDTLRETNSDIIDIMLVIDQSSSMLAQDFQPNRLGAAKNVAKTFIKDRQGDRLGIIIFAGQSFIQCPLTTDTGVLVDFTDQIEIVDKEYDGTAIGMAIANAINRLRDSDTKSKIIILLSDGSNNQGELDPLTAADLAEKFGIKIYTVGAGSKGTAPYPVTDVWGRTTIQNVEVDMDEETLRKIADVTGGKFFRATDNESLKRVYQEINQLERTKVEVTEYQNIKELYSWFTIPAALLALLYFAMSDSIYRRFA
ncbi:MAG: VWA domain-containing protein [FCB group bacterium]|nr:VWA domain-containing protein [FCB group bacterium]